MKRTILTGVALLVATVGVWVLCGHGGSPAVSKGEQAPLFSAGHQRRIGDGYACSGWSIHPYTKTAIEQAFRSAMGGAATGADLMLVFYTAHHDPHDVAAIIRAQPNAPKRILGWSVQDGILGADGFHAGVHGAVGVLGLRLDNLSPGVGAAGFDEAETPAAAAKLALGRAMADAGHSPQDEVKPSMILLSSTIGHEEEVLQAFEEVCGRPVPVIGGSCAGSKERVNREFITNWSLVTNDRVLTNGLVVAALYSAPPFGWAYRGGFDRTGKAGVITDCDRRLIRQINGRPAVEVYDEWLGGRLKEARDQKKFMVAFTALYPLCRTLTRGEVSHNQFVHVWPTENTANPNCLITAANVHKNEVLYFSEGTWNILLNRLGILVEQARQSQADADPAAALFIGCGSVLDNIPLDHRDQMASLVDRSLGDVPWLGVFTWGEQGNVPALGNLQGNLTTSVLLVPGRDKGAR